MTDLRCRRPLWRAAGAVAGGAAPGRPGVLRGVLLVLVLAAIPALIYGVVTLGYAVLVVPAVLFALGLVAAYYGPQWWALGGGWPLLQIDGDELRGRIRPVTRADRADDPDWWDVRLRPADVAGVRMARTERDLDQQMVAIDLIPGARAGLLADPSVGPVAERIDAAAGTPVAWSAPMMSPARSRRADVERLIASLDSFAARD